MSRRAASVTSAEVATRAGVSQATVSYVLNDAPGHTISPKTRARVLQAARQLNYRPNVAARSLRTGKGESVLFPVPGPVGHVLAQMIEACSVALQARGLTLVTDVTSLDDTDALLGSWLRVHPAAVIDLLIPHGHPVLPALRRAGVAVLSSAGDPEALWASTGDVFAMEARKTQLGYLLSKGHRHIALVMPKQAHSDRRVERRMLQQLRKVATGAGAELAVERAPLTSAGIDAVVTRWVRDGLPDAVCGFADDYALAVLTALQARGVAVPADVAVIGVDDTPAASYITPGLTTIAADFVELAEAIARSVADPDAKAPLPPPGHHLVVRASA